MARYEASDYPWWRRGPYGFRGEGWRTPERGYVEGAEESGESRSRRGKFDPRRGAGFTRGYPTESRMRSDPPMGGGGQRTDRPRYSGDYPRLGGGRGIDSWARDNIDEPDRYRSHPIYGRPDRSDRMRSGGEPKRRSDRG
jgi:hypothetical protein